MLPKRIRNAVLLASLALGSPLMSAAAGPARPATPVVVLTAEEASDLTFMREEEKLARDLYLALGERWGDTPFAAIANAEQQHMNTLLRMIVKYRLPDPAAGALIGEFRDADLQALHAELLEKGNRSALDALLVGGLVEEIDIRDNEDAAATSSRADLDIAYAALTCGSRNHLRAFAAGVAAATGQAYVAQYLPPAQVGAIVGSPLERCGRP
ncbi:MAG: DUF2202 domain-containing protein [Betaproteobacteria bacterium]|nr:DUF2202 domain-containing protein [Betaproteobacteria bacterium]